MKSQIAIILVSPENPDNIGAVARAMKNMALRDLRLVRPPAGWKTKGRKLARSARDILEGAKAYPSLKRAVADTHFVVGTTRRLGPKRGRVVEFSKAIKTIKTKSKRRKVGILFGKESKGLDNEALELCDSVISIPSDEAYPSLNLAQAVMVVVFSLFLKDRKNSPAEAGQEFSFCRKEEIAGALAHFKQALIALDYGKIGGNLLQRVMVLFAGIFKRGGMLEPEAQMIHGFSRAILERLEKE